MCCICSVARHNEAIGIVWQAFFGSCPGQVLRLQRGPLACRCSGSAGPAVFTDVAVGFAMEMALSVIMPAIIGLAILALINLGAREEGGRDRSKKRGRRRG